MSMLCVMGTGRRRFRFSDEQIMAAITFILFLKDPLPVQKLVRKEGRRPAILLGLRDNENDYGVIKVSSWPIVRRKYISYDQSYF